jgi:DNA-binding YbaB/EbfC family protein
VKDLGFLMKQAQAMQAKLKDAQARLAQTEVDGAAGGGLVRVTLMGTGELVRLSIEDSLINPGDGEIIADLIVAAHADAKRKLDAKQSEIMRDVAGPLAGLPGIPGF